jgi:hypothetical protein
MNGSLSTVSLLGALNDVRSSDELFVCSCGLLQRNQSALRYTHHHYNIVMITEDVASLGYR